ncbi:MAG TPA: ricin-type beta-trefoil lectin domain protein [Actinocrinis sp.]|nr:ricin-type beta-trefoil lectin domain protein [Actinocrinis sp.]
MRLTRTKATLTALPLVAAGGLLLALNGSAQAAGPALPAHFAAPYLQISTSDSGDMNADLNATGLKYYTLAFLIPQSGCTPQWEDGNYGLTTFNSQISSLQAAGGQVIISSGGAQGGELAQTCTSVSSLTSAYANIVNSTGVTRLDFDIEGGTLGDTAATTRRDQALAALQRQNPAVQVDFTLGVAPSGLPTGNGSEYALLQDAKTQGVNVSIVNIMTMDFYDGQPVLSDAESAARNTANQLAGLYGISTSAAYAKMGLTPIAGTNDDGASFSQSDAQSLESFAASNGVAELAFWEVDGYDKGTGYAYSRIFNQLTGGTNPPPPPPPGSGPVTGYQGLCLDVRGANSADGTPVQVYSCNGTNAQSWSLTSSNQLQALGKCLDVSAAGTANGTKVQLYSCNGTGAQVWQHQSNGEYVNPNSGKCLDDTGFGGSGTQVQIWACADSTNQQWSLP